MVVKVELDAVKSHDLMILVAIVIQAIHLLIYHLHNLVFVQAVKIRGVAPNNAHLVVREIFIAHDSFEPRDVVPAIIVAGTAAMQLLLFLMQALMPLKVDLARVLTLIFVSRFQLLEKVFVLQFARVVCTTFFGFWTVEGTAKCDQIFII